MLYAKKIAQGKGVIIPEEAKANSAAMSARIPGIRLVVSPGHSDWRNPYEESARLRGRVPLYRGKADAVVALMKSYLLVF